MAIDFQPKSNYLRTMRSGISTVSSKSSTASPLQATPQTDTFTHSDSLITIDVQTCTLKPAKGPINLPSQEVLQKKIETLTEELKNDESFSKDPRRSYMENPVGRELVSTIILADPDLQEQIAKNLWNDAIQANKNAMFNPTIYKVHEVPPSYKDYDIPALLMSDDYPTSSTILSGYSHIVMERARTTGLTENERLLSHTFEETEFLSHATFDDKMKSIRADIEANFEANGMTFDTSKTFDVSLDTTQFLFKVSGGTEKENALIEQALNITNVGKHSYDKNNLSKTIWALQNHRRDDGSYNSWSLDDMHLSPEKKAAELQEHGVSTASKSYIHKIKDQLYPAYHLHELNQRMQCRYGFGLDAFTVNPDNTLSGKTEASKALLETDGDEFMKEKGESYLTFLKKYQGTPTFNSPVFQITNGTFHVLYED